MTGQSLDLGAYVWMGARAVLERLLFGLMFRQMFPQMFRQEARVAGGPGVEVRMDDQQQLQMKHLSCQEA